MKIKLQILFLGILVFGSCRDPYTTSGSTPSCSWNSEQDIAVDPIALKVPSGMSSFFMGSVPGDKIFRNLQQPLWQGNYSSSKNVAKISGDLISDGSACNGSKTYSLPSGSSKIGSYFLKLITPSQGFYGTAKMTIRSDDFKSSSNPGIAEYVIWSGSSSNPDYPTIYGALTGVRKTYDPTAGKIILSSKGNDGCYYSNGQQICP
tara:strand:- start:2386 stop:3000 length:615 start_codon:yes stop_codon:yes gene_type:complete